MTIPPDRVTVNNLFIKRPNIHVGTTGTLVRQAAIRPCLIQHLQITSRVLLMREIL